MLLFSSKLCLFDAKVCPSAMINLLFFSGLRDHEVPLQYCVETGVNNGAFTGMNNGADLKVKSGVSWNIYTDKASGMNTSTPSKINTCAAWCMNSGIKLQGWILSLSQKQNTPQSMNTGTTWRKKTRAAEDIYTGAKNEFPHSLRDTRMFDIEAKGWLLRGQYWRSFED